MPFREIEIGICAYNEENNIRHLIENIQNQKLSKNFRLSKIIVISSGSTDDTNKIVEDIKAYDERVLLVREEERRGKSHALNKLFEFVEGDLLFIISADILPSEGSLEKLAKTITGRVGAAIAKTVAINPDKGYINYFSKFIWKIHDRLLKEESSKNRLNHLGGDMYVLRSDLITKIPGDIINDDAYLGINVCRKNFKIKFVENAEEYMMGPQNIRDYLKQRIRIIVGHKQIAGRTGESATTLGVLIMKEPLYSFRIFIEEASKIEIKHFPKLLLGVFLELVARIIASQNYRKTEQYIKWETPETTKKLA